MRAPWALRAQCTPPRSAGQRVGQPERAAARALEPRARHELHSARFELTRVIRHPRFRRRPGAAAGSCPGSEHGIALPAFHGGVLRALPARPPGAGQGHAVDGGVLGPDPAGRRRAAYRRADRANRGGGFAGMDPDQQPVVDWAAELRAAGFATAILSNMPSDKLAYMRKIPAFDWIDEFPGDGVLLRPPPGEARTGDLSPVPGPPRERARGVRVSG